ncbi:MAG: flagellar protein [Bradyrhizobium sp.]|uniref:flagellar protein n=1 Tax=Bradyrhizobium sp. TaxID=376 RepID=UPI001DF43B10|nr:flagellar protein [Bradyrhizobium sp.]MBV9564647.1 flagellar protein [Bradyrhizobium sp.]
MSISSINYASSLLGQSVRNIQDQLTNLSTQLSSGVKSTNYAGMGVNEGFAIAARAQLANMSAFGTTMTNVNTIISAVNTGLQTMSEIGGSVQSEAAATPQNLTSGGQTIGQQNALSQLSAMVGILNTQVGSRYVFSGTAINIQAVASADTILNGTGTQAGLKQVIAERQQADLGSNGMGRLVVTPPGTGTPPTSTTATSVAEDVAGSPFGLKLNAVSSSLTNATVTGPSGSPVGITVDFAGGNPNPGDQITLSFNEPDGTTGSFTLTATSQSPPPAGGFTIGATPAATASNFNTTLTSSISTLANTSLVAASAVEAGDNFFNTDGTATGLAGNNQAVPAAPISGATALSGTAGSDSLSAGFAPGNTITVDGTTITFITSGATGNQLNVTDSVQTLLNKIDQITGTSTPSTIHGGAITLHTDDASTFSITSNNVTAFAALGFSGTVTAAQPPLRVSGSPLGSAVSLVNGSATTVGWYTGNSGPGPARDTSTARIDSAQTVDFGAQANEQAIRQQLQNVAVYAAVTASPTNTNSPAMVSALSQRIAAGLTPQPGQQTIQDMQTDFANAQTTIKNVTAQQTQAHTALQNLVADTEGISQDQVASEILQLQNNLSASYQTTAMLAQLTLTKYL